MSGNNGAVAEVLDLTVAVRCNRDDLDLIDSLARRYGATSRSQLFRTALHALARQGGVGREQLLRAAHDALRAALALPEEAAGAESVREPEPGQEPPRVACEYGTGCDRAAANAVRVGGATVRLCDPCLEVAWAVDRRFRRNKVRKIGGAA